LAAPDHAALPLGRFGRNAKGHVIGDIQSTFEFQRGAGCRQVFDRATDRTASAEFDQPGLQDPVTRCRTAFGHEANVEGISKRFRKRRRRGR